ncbi:hypothetical protein PIB30_045008 [Stylosanthes scabra]|uniref:Uncharacterized protein n=1 Tax=Stylosanthes scabra TaxID=79078 RepID=A0ABU6ZES3_9FABA|nr:hypothetical protein [Stylosanthes scabra]
MIDLIGELVWIKNLYHELRVEVSVAPLIYYDNLSAVLLAANPILHSKSKHFKTDDYTSFNSLIFSNSLFPFSPFFPCSSVETLTTFVSINRGSSQPFTDPQTNITWTQEDAFIDHGESFNVSLGLGTLSTLRAFHNNTLKKNLVALTGVTDSRDAGFGYDVPLIQHLGYLSGHDLRGVLPDFSSMDALETMNLSHNRFSGSIPASLKNTKIDIDTTNNCLYGMKCPILIDSPPPPQHPLFSDDDEDNSLPRSLLLSGDDEPSRSGNMKLDLLLIGGVLFIKFF